MEKKRQKRKMTSRKREAEKKRGERRKEGMGRRKGEREGGGGHREQRRHLAVSITPLPLSQEDSTDIVTNSKIQCLSHREWLPHVELH